MAENNLISLDGDDTSSELFEVDIARDVPNAPNMLVTEAREPATLVDMENVATATSFANDMTEIDRVNRANVLSALFDVNYASGPSDAPINLLVELHNLGNAQDTILIESHASDMANVADLAESTNVADLANVATAVGVPVISTMLVRTSEHHTNSPETYILSSPALQQINTIASGYAGTEHMSRDELIRDRNLRHFRSPIAEDFAINSLCKIKKMSNQPLHFCFSLICGIFMTVQLSVMMQRADTMAELFALMFVIYGIIVNCFVGAFAYIYSTLAMPLMFVSNSVLITIHMSFTSKMNDAQYVAGLFICLSITIVVTTLLYTYMCYVYTRSIEYAIDAIRY